MSDSGRVFKTEALRAEVESLRTVYAAFFEKLKHIPHLRLPLQFDLEALRHEAIQVDEWIPVTIESRHWNKKDVDIFSYSNQGRALIEYIPDSRCMTDSNSRNRPTQLAQYRPDGRLKYFDTELLDRMPQTRQLIYSICDYPTRARVMRTPGGYNIPWHSHHNDNVVNASYFFGVIQVPLISEGVVYSIKSFDPQFPEEFPLEYRPGEAYFFNSYQMHSVRNPSSDARTSLFLTFNLEYQGMINFLKPLVEAYDGPLVGKSSERQLKLDSL